MLLVGAYAVSLMLSTGEEIEEAVFIEMPRMSHLTQTESHLLEQQTYFEKVLRLAEEVQLDLSSGDEKSLMIVTREFNRNNLLFRELSARITDELDKASLKYKGLSTLKAYRLKMIVISYCSRGLKR